MYPKRIVGPLILSGALALSLIAAGCGGTSHEQASAAPTVTPAPSVAPAATPAPEPSPTPTPSLSPKAAAVAYSMVTSQAIVQLNTRLETITRLMDIRNLDDPQWRANVRLAASSVAADTAAIRRPTVPPCLVQTGKDVMKFADATDAMARAIITGVDSQNVVQLEVAKVLFDTANTALGNVTTHLKTELADCPQ